MKKICLINVGANSSHRNLESVLFSNGHFEFVPIPDPCMEGSKIGVRFNQLLVFNGVRITELVAKKYHEKFAHNDPEFATYTYGDYPAHHPRAANLKKLEKGDWLFFFARLVPWSKERNLGKPKFGLIGFIEIEGVYKNILQKPPKSTFKEIRNNAHIIRAESNDFFYDGFWIFRGSKNSSRFRRAVIFDRNFITQCGITDVKGQEIEWERFSSELAAIGSYFRSSRLIDSEEQIHFFWHKVLNEQITCP